MRGSSTKVSAIVLVLAVVVAILVRPAAPPASQHAAASGSGGSSNVGPSAPACSASKAQRGNAGLRPTPNSTTSAPAAAGRLPVGSTGGAAWHSRATDDGVYIVRFRQYRMAADHLSALQAGLADAAGVPAGSWVWVERRNKAAAYPTDFGLVRLSSAHQEAVKARLAQLPLVRDVHPERQISRSLMAAADAAEEQQQQQQGVGSLSGMHSAPCRDGDDGGVDATCVAKRPGRLQTRPTFSLEDNLCADGCGDLPGGVGNGTIAAARRRRRLLQQGTLASILQADALWAQGFAGQGVKMGVFDTGIKGDHPDVKHIVERSNWTHEPTLDDGLGHGSFVAGVIAGTDAACPGLAPEVLLYTFRVFTNDQVSYTSWFLDAFNYAMASGMNVVNLSIGGPDYLDEPFVDKVAEITSAGIIMVSAIGNDGPLYGTLNNPADQNDVIGIGGIDYSDQIAPFSSRGMSTWEVPLGYGRSKPDVMAFGRDVQGSRIGGGCRSLSGTSVASPVVAGAVCLLASVVPEAKRWQLLNPASMKQALVEGAVRLPGLNLYEQGAGKLSVVGSKAVLEAYHPRASLVPPTLNFTDCPYMWPFCRQPLYATAMPLMFNATILNGLGLTGKLEAAPTWTPSDEGGRLLDVQFEYSEQLWPWSGYLALYLRVKDEGADFLGTASGTVSFTVVSPPGPGEAAQRHSLVSVPLTAAIIPTPHRRLRVLWDQFHSIRYPPAYFPRDDLQVRHDILDWHGDHPHTNYHDMYDALRDEGFFLEVLASPATCFNASHYAALLLVDSEDEFYAEEVAKLAADVEQLGLGLLVFADWYHLESVRRLRFFDDNTRSWWEAATGGANVPALNDLLVPFGAAFGEGALDVDVHVPGGQQALFAMASGVPLKALPAGAWLHRAQPKAEEAKEGKPGAPVLALMQHGGGRLALYGDSNCLDSSHQRSRCFKLLTHLLEWAGGKKAPGLTPPEALLVAPFGDFEGLPQRRPDYNFTQASPVLQTPLRCYPNSPPAFHAATFDRWKVAVSRPVRQPVAVQQEPAAVQQQGQPQREQQQQQQQQQQPNDAPGAATGGGGGAEGTTQQAGGGAAATGSAVQGTQQQQQQQQVQPGVTDASGQALAQPGVVTQQTPPADTSTNEQQQASGAEAQAQQAAEEQRQAAAQAQAEELRRQEEALLKKQQEAEQAAGGARQEPVGTTGAGGAAGGGGAAEQAGAAAGRGGDSPALTTTTDDGREHPALNGLAQFGDGLPQHVESVEREKQPADGKAGKGGEAGGASGATGEAASGGAQTVSSLLGRGKVGGTAASPPPGFFARLSGVQALALTAVALLVVWSRSRRRRGQAARPPQPRKGLLPMWSGGFGGAAQRGRHE